MKFPNTAVPPSAVTDLHRLHFELHVKFALDRQSYLNGKVHSATSVRTRLAEFPSYENLEEESPLMSFLKRAIPHGGIRFDEVRQRLEECRSSASLSEKQRSGVRGTQNNGDGTRTVISVAIPKYPHVFARELAHMIEWAGGSVTDDEAKATDDAKTILNLYLEGVVSLPLAVAFAERKTSHSAMLWEMLVSYCLGTTTVEHNPGDTPLAKSDDAKESCEHPESNGLLFGSLLEVAARSGADLAHLIVCVPPEMRIEGIRPKLVAAICDYRLKLKIHEAALDIFLSDKVSLLRDQCHRARRGLRVDLPSDLLAVAVGDVEDDTCQGFNRKLLEQKREERQFLLHRRESRHETYL